MREDRIIVRGVVLEALPSTTFTVKPTDSPPHAPPILASLSGKMRIHHITVLPGDTVDVEVSPYDTSRGRIVSRERTNT
jgi:translation initiation factor IF-1